MTDDEGDEVQKQVRKLVVEHAETRWLTLRLDKDIQEIHESLRDHTHRLSRIEGTLQEHSAKFDSVDAQLRSLTQMVGEVLHRLPGDEGER
jgi:septal ring factor EnvC (AmiA/AmiB activator)